MKSTLSKKRKGYKVSPIETQRKLVDDKPVGEYSRKDLISLEHEWRLKLKADGFKDIEMWDNRPKRNNKKIKFIRGHIRLHWFKTYQNFVRMGAQSFEYYRMIGLFAHHYKGPMPAHYKELLQDYANHGYRNTAIANVAPHIKPSAIEMYLIRNLKKIIDFVNKLDKEESYE